MSVTSNVNKTAFEDDFGKSADELELKYSPHGDGEHPLHTRAEWRDEVNQDTTISGYWQWLSHMLGND